MLKNFLDDATLLFAFLLAVGKEQDVLLDHVVYDSVLTLKVTNPKLNLTLGGTARALHGRLKMPLLLAQVMRVEFARQYLRLGFQLAHLACHGGAHGALSRVKESFLESRHELLVEILLRLLTLLQHFLDDHFF